MSLIDLDAVAARALDLLSKAQGHYAPPEFREDMRFLTTAVFGMIGEVRRLGERLALFTATVDRRTQERDVARAQVLKLRSALAAWANAHDDTGFDTGPSLREHDVAKEARELLAETQ